MTAVASRIVFDAPAGGLAGRSPGRMPRRLQRLAEELDESGLQFDGDGAVREILLEEIDHALRPDVHERRVASNGTIIEPKSDPTTWAARAQLEMTRGAVGEHP